MPSMTPQQRAIFESREAEHRARESRGDRRVVMSRSDVIAAVDGDVDLSELENELPPASSFHEEGPTDSEVDDITRSLVQAQLPPRSLVQTQSLEDISLLLQRRVGQLGITISRLIQATGSLTEEPVPTLTSELGALRTIIENMRMGMNFSGAAHFYRESDDEENELLEVPKTPPLTARFELDGFDWDLQWNKEAQHVRVVRSEGVLRTRTYQWPLQAALLPDKVRAEAQTIYDAAAPQMRPSRWAEL